MTHEDRQRYIEKIRKLLALGNSNFDEEARTSLHKAFKLMKEHSIELHEVAAQERTLDEMADEVDEIISSHMSAIGREGGLKGGPARARKLSARRRREIARQAGLASGEARRRRS